MVKYIAGTVIFICTVISILGVMGLSDFEVEGLTTKEISFKSGKVNLVGTLIVPENIQNPPIALIVHGDGPQNRFSDGGYIPLIHSLVDKGIGVFTWDKAGIGKSSGNWLEQSMEDRSDEALAARQAIAALDKIDINNIGFIGFSQAGWVLPRVSNKVTPAFTVIIGGAVSWRNQGTYYSKVGMQHSGIPENQITKRLTERRQKNDQIFTYPVDPSAISNTPKDRINFVANAYWEDATEHISEMRGPVLAIWGKDDLNVDAAANSTIYRDQLSPLSDTRKVVVLEGAGHGLQRSYWFNYQTSDDWPWYLEYLYLAMGRDFYSESALSEITGWINAVANKKA